VNGIGKVLPYLIFNRLFKLPTGDGQHRRERLQRYAVFWQPG